MNLNACSKLLAVLALLLFLPGCTQFLRGDVVSFHEDSLPMGETIRVEAADPEKANSLEFRAYAAMVGEELRKLGYTPLEGAGATATLIAEVDYSVQASGETRSSRHFPPYVRYHFYYGQVRDPFYFGFDNSWTEEVMTTPSYLRQLSMDIVRNEPLRTRLFEGRVRSSGHQGELAQVMPYLVTALFANFPGESGVTKVVTIEMNE